MLQTFLKLKEIVANFALFTPTNRPSLPIHWNEPRCSSIERLWSCSSRVVDGVNGQQINEDLRRQEFILLINHSLLHFVIILLHVC